MSLLSDGDGVWTTTIVVWAGVGAGVLESLSHGSSSGDGDEGIGTADFVSYDASFNDSVYAYGAPAEELIRHSYTACMGSTYCLNWMTVLVHDPIHRSTVRRAPMLKLYSSC